MALITAVPANIRIHQYIQPMAEINFLCVHKKLRSKRLAPVLIKEITRRVNLQDRWQAVYTAGTVLPRPVGRCRYYHRSLNPKKLVEVNDTFFVIFFENFWFQVGFCRQPPHLTMANFIKSLKLPTATEFPFQSTTPDDIPGITELLNTYLRK